MNRLRRRRDSRIAGWAGKGSGGPVREPAVVVDRVAGRCGELVLRRDGEHYEVIANGVFLMDSRNGESERLLVSAAASRMPAAGAMLIGGLGVGFSLAQAIAEPAVERITVVEREPAVIEWARGPLRGFNLGSLDEPRVRVVEADLVEWLGAGAERFDAICLDIDNGPRWTVSPGNAALYSETGLRTLATRLTAGGVLAVWGAAADPEFERRLRSRFGMIEVLTVRVPRGEPDVVWLAHNQPSSG